MRLSLRHEKQQTPWNLCLKCTYIVEEERVRTRGVSYLNIPYMDPMGIVKEVLESFVSYMDTDLLVQFPEKKTDSILKVDLWY